MIIDSSALVAIIAGEPEREQFLLTIGAAAVRKMSAASLVETSIVINRRMSAPGIPLLRQFIADAGIEIAAFTANQARLAFEAYRRFGKGMGHPSQLNILDCCTYALAAESGEPVLFKGADFDKTDIAVAH